MNDQTLNSSPDGLSGPRAGLTTEVRAGIILFVCVFLFYFLKAPSFAVPGRWAGILASFTGLDPFRPVIRPIWSFIMIIISALPLPDLALTVHILSSLLGAGVCWLLFSIVRRIPFSRSFRRKDRNVVEQVPRLAAGLFAALFAAVSLPMITISTRGDFYVLEMFLMLLPFYPLMQFRETRQLSKFPLSCFFFGLALIEYPHMVLILPGFAVWWVLLLWKNTWLKTSTIVFSLMLLASGVLVVLVFTMYFSTTPAAMVRDQTGTPEIMKEYFRFYIGELTGGVPKVGWLLILAMNIAPFFVVMLRELSEPTDRFSAIGVYVFRLVLLFIAVLILFELPGSPAHVLGKRIMLIAPTVIVAIWFGFLAGYYVGLFREKKKSFLANGLIALLSVMFLAAAIRHAQASSVNHLAPVAAFTDRVIQTLDERNFLITDGSLDASLKLAARKAGRHVNLINSNVGQSEQYGRYYATMFIEPELQNLAMLGTRALLRGWLDSRPGADRTLAILTNPEVISTPGHQIIPDGFYYRVVGLNESLNVKALFSRAETMWTGWIMPDVSRMETGDSGWFQSQFVIRWLSRLANDLGVLLDEHELVDLAGESYRQSLSFWPDNISATLNLREQAIQQDEEAADAITEILKAQLERNPAAFNIHFLNQYCGQVRSPMALLEQAAVLGSAGRMQQAMTKLESVAGLIDEDNIGARLAMARLYLRGNNPDASESIYNSLLAKDPKNLDAYYGLFQIALVRRNADEAARIVGVMQDLGADPKRLLLARAELNLSTGKLDEARRQLLEITRDPGAPIEAWFALAQVAIQLQDHDLIDAAFATLERDRNYIPGLLLLGERAILQRRPQDARRYFSRIVALDPANEAALVRLIQMDFAERDAALLRLHTAALLALNPEHPFANFMSSYVHVDAERYDLAEAALRRGLAGEEHAAARNELAWVLARQQRYQEALPHAERAVELAPQNFNHLDTLAEILWKLNRRDEAFAALENVLELSRRREPALMLHAAQIYLEAGENDLAGSLIRELEDIRDMLTPEHRDDLARLTRKLKR